MSHKMTPSALNWARMAFLSCLGCQWSRTLQGRHLKPQVFKGRGKLILDKEWNVEQEAIARRSYLEETRYSKNWDRCIW